MIVLVADDTPETLREYFWKDSPILDGIVHTLAVYIYILNSYILLVLLKISEDTAPSFGGSIPTHVFLFQHEITDTE